MNNEPITRQEFNEFRDFVIHHIATKKELIDLQTKVASNHNEVMIGFDAVLKTLSDMRDENAAHYHMTYRHDIWIKELAVHTHYTLNNEV